MSQYQDIENPYREVKNETDTHKYVPDLHSLDNGNTIIIFENSQSGSIDDTLIAARQQWESRWRRLPFYLAYECKLYFRSVLALLRMHWGRKTCCGSTPLLRLVASLKLYPNRDMLTLKSLSSRYIQRRPYGFRMYEDRSARCVEECCRELGELS